MLFVKVNLANNDIICKAKETRVLLCMTYQFLITLTWYKIHPSSMKFMIREKMY
jgi:hypothetical protein